MLVRCDWALKGMTIVAQTDVFCFLSVQTTYMEMQLSELYSQAMFGKPIAADAVLTMRYSHGATLMLFSTWNVNLRMSSSNVGRDLCSSRRYLHTNNNTDVEYTSNSHAPP